MLEGPKLKVQKLNKCHSQNRHSNQLKLHNSARVLHLTKSALLGCLQFQILFYVCTSMIQKVNKLHSYNRHFYALISCICGYVHEAVNLKTTLGNGTGDWNLTITALQGACDLKHLQTSTNKQIAPTKLLFLSAK